MEYSHRSRRRKRQIFPMALLPVAVLLAAVIILVRWKTPDTSERLEISISESSSIQTEAAPEEGKESEMEETVSTGEQKETEVSQEDLVSEQATMILETMTLEEKVGQMFIARCPAEDAANKAAEYHLGGYILFAQDFENRTPDQVTEAIQSYQNAAKIPMLMGVDEEGGTVTRISRYPAFRQEPFPSPQELYEAGGMEAVVRDTEEKCQLLKSRINVNFAPVCDVSTDENDFIYDRSFGKDGKQTARYAETVVSTMKEQQIGSVLKHFPGYGNNVDTHTGTAYDKRPLETFETSDFLPFQAGIAEGADMVLVSHNIVEAMDDQYPASLSPRVHEILRKELGFTGVIMTDDLVMEGVREFTDDEQAAALAVQAGNDLLCCTDFEVQIPAVVEAVKQGENSEEQVDQSVMRILEMKIRLGIVRK
ncbi:MAG: glycoside hydrolase family 3 protein [Lachnospiraceae bacterium]